MKTTLINHTYLKPLLAELKRITKFKYDKSCKGVIGIPIDTLKGLTRKKKPLPFSAKVVARISAFTNIAVDSLLNYRPGRQLFTTVGKPFSEKSYILYRTKVEVEQGRNPTMQDAGDQTFRLFLVLWIKCGQLLLAAHSHRRDDPKFVAGYDAGFVAGKLLSEIRTLGCVYPDFQIIGEGGKILPSGPRDFAGEMQSLMDGMNPKTNKPMANPFKPLRLVQIIQSRFNRELTKIESEQRPVKQKKQAARK